MLFTGRLLRNGITSRFLGRLANMKCSRPPQTRFRQDSVRVFSTQAEPSAVDREAAGQGAIWETSPQIYSLVCLQATYTRTYTTLFPPQLTSFSGRLPVHSVPGALRKQVQLAPHFKPSPHNAQHPHTKQRSRPPVSFASFFTPIIARPLSASRVVSQSSGTAS